MNGTLESQPLPGSAADAAPVVKDSGTAISTARATAWNRFMFPPTPRGGPAPAARTDIPSLALRREHHNGVAPAFAAPPAMPRPCTHADRPVRRPTIARARPPRRRISRSWRRSGQFVVSHAGPIADEPATSSGQASSPSRPTRSTAEPDDPSNRHRTRHHRRPDPNFRSSSGLRTPLPPTVTRVGKGLLTTLLNGFRSGSWCHAGRPVMVHSHGGEPLQAGRTLRLSRVDRPIHTACRLAGRPGNPALAISALGPVHRTLP